MADRVLSLPDPSPEDDEDVVWGLSTATALWARGERKDAVVWLRRAAEAASAAGQDFRASQLGICASELEDAIAADPGGSAAPSDEAVEAEVDVVAEEPAAGSPAAEATSHAPAAAKAEPPSAPPPPAPPPAPATAPAAPSAAPAAPRAARPVSPWAQTLTSPPSPSTAPPARAPSVAVQAAPPLASEPPAPPVATFEAPAPAAVPPGRVTAPTSTPAPKPPAPVASAPAPAPPAPAAPEPSSRAPVPSQASPGSQAVVSTTVTRPKPKPRAPILDPWSEATPSSAHEEPASVTPRKPPPPPPPVGSGGSVLVEVRTRPSPDDDDEDVVTSAPLLETALGRKPRPPAPPAPPPPPAPARKPADAAPASSARPQPPSAPVEPPATSQEGAASLGELRAAVPAKRPPASSSADAPAPAAPSVPPKPPAPAAPPASVSTPASPPPAPTSAAPPPARPPVPAPAATSPAPAAPSTPAASTPSSSEPPAPKPPPPPAPAASPAPPPEPAATSASDDAGGSNIAGVAFDDIPSLADLPEETQHALAGSARVEAFAADEEVSAFGAALVLEGSAFVCATIVDVAAMTAGPCTVIASRGTLAEPIGLRVVAGATGTKLAIWDAETFDAALQPCPWVMDEIREAADKLQALAGATMGPLGELDDPTREGTLARLAVRVLAPGEQLVARGGASLGIVLVGAGAIELVDDDGSATQSLSCGDPLFPDTAIGGGPAPQTARAGAGGAIVLVAERKIASALFAEFPSLLELFAS